MLKSKYFYIALLIAGYFLLRKPLTNWYQNRLATMQALQTNDKVSGYTTYNISNYVPAPISNALNFMRPSNGSKSGGASVVVANDGANYSVQG